VLAAFVLVTSANQMLWLTFAPLTTDAAKHYGVGEGAIGALSAVFPLLYVLLALPMGIALDRWFHNAVKLGALLTAVGALVRLADDAYAWVLIGQLLVAFAQPLVTNSVAKVGGAYSTEQDRPTAIAVCSAGLFAGMLLAFATAAAFGTEHVRALLAVQAAYAVVGAALLVLGMREPGRLVDETPIASGKDALREVWADRLVRSITVLVVVGFGVFVGLTTWLQALLEPDGVSETEAGVLLLVMVVAGVAGSLVLPPVAARRGWERRVLLASLVVTAAGSALLAVVHPLLAIGVVLAAMGTLLLATLPIVLEVMERRTGSASGTGAAILWMSGNAGGLVVTGVLAALLDAPAAAFLVLAAISLLGLPVLRRMPAESLRP
jgi:predicted MFS family arabinose efflux permease